MRRSLLEPVFNYLFVSTARNGKEIQLGLVQNKFNLFGPYFAYFLLTSSIILVILLVSDTGVAQTKESTKSKTLREKNTITESKKETKESFRITSPIGWRVDPMTRGWAVHQGVDIAGKKVVPY